MAELTQVPGCPLEVKLSSIGTFRCKQSFPQQAPRQGVINAPRETGVIKLHPGFNYEQALTDIEGFERLWLVYLFDRNDNWKPMTLPPRGTEKRGVFATRAPYRPNPIGLTCVKLIERKGLNLTVAEFDLLDKTPILDIKPYLPYADSFPDASAGWTAMTTESCYRVILSDKAARQAEWIFDKSGYDINALLMTQLSLNPEDGKRKRVQPLGHSTGLYVIAAKTWRAHFTINNNEKIVQVLEIKSAYTERDMIDPDDPYQDKAIHKEFYLAGR